MIKTPNLNLPVYDNVSKDTFRVADWNEANTNIDYVFGELKKNPSVNAIDITARQDIIKNREDIINNHTKVTSQLESIATITAESELNTFTNPNVRIKRTDNLLLTNKGEILTKFGACKILSTLPNANYSIDTTRKINGDNSLKIDLNKLNTNQSRVSLDVNINVVENDVLGLWIYIENVFDFSQFRIVFKNVQGGTNEFVHDRFEYDFSTGWNFIKFKKKDFVANGTPTWDNFKECGIQIFPRPSNTLQGDGYPTIYIDSLVKNRLMKPCVIINFDDSVKSMYINAFPYMKSKGIKGTMFFCNRSSNAPSFMTPEMHKDLFDNGWDIGSHSKSHNDVVDLRTNLNYEEQMYDLKYAHDTILENGYGRRCNVFSPPNGKYNNITLKILKELGYKMTRTSLGDNGDTVFFDNGLLKINTYEFSDYTTLDVTKARIDKAFEYGSVLSLFTHGVENNNTDPYSCDLEKFKQVIEYLISKGFEFITFNDFYNNALGNEILIDADLMNKNVQEKIIIGNINPNISTSGSIFVKRGGSF